PNLLDSSFLAGASLGAEADIDAAPASPSANVLPLLDPTGEVRPLEEVEREVIRFALSHYGGQMSEVARRLKIGRSTLYRKLDTLGIDADITVGSAPGPVAAE